MPSHLANPTPATLRRADLRDVSDAGLVLALGFDPQSVVGSAGSEVALDSSGYANHGVNSGATYDPDGGPFGGGAFTFDGLNDTLTIPNAANLAITGPFSLSCRIRTLDGNAILCGRYNYGAHAGFFFGTYNNELYLAINGVSYRRYAAHDTCDDGWHHLVGVWDGSDAHVYVDGALADGKTTGSPQDPLDGACDFIVGRWAPGAWYAGDLCGVRLDTRALSAAEARCLFLRRAQIPLASVPQRALHVDADGNVGVDVRAFGANAAKVLALSNDATQATTSPDIVQLAAKDNASNQTVLSLRQESAVQADTDETQVSHKAMVEINGAYYWIPLYAV